VPDYFILLQVLPKLML